MAQVTNYDIISIYRIHRTQRNPSLLSSSTY